jgi:hypothetical protein
MRPGARTRVRAALVGLAGLVLSSGVLAGCSTARLDVGTTDESCYLALPTAAKAVGGHGHLAGVHKFSPGSLKAVAPRLERSLQDRVPKGRSICLAAYTGHFTRAETMKPIGRLAGAVAVAVVTSPGNDLLGTVILARIPLRFQHLF